MPNANEYLPIAEHGVIGNLHTAALVGMDGSIDWCCLPELDSPSVFSALLDARRGGRFRVAPAEIRARAQHYVEGTNVLRTELQGPDGELVITDFMPVTGDLREANEAWSPAAEIHRLLECGRGTSEVVVEWSPRFDYGRDRPRITREGGRIIAHGARDERLTLDGLRADEAEVRDEESGPVVVGRLELEAGERRALSSRFGPGGGSTPDLDACMAALEETIGAWRRWTHSCHPGEECVFAGPVHHHISRAGLILKLLTHRHSGAIAAAPTTSLPEEIGGVRNWDYRFSWIRDSSLVAQALYSLDHQHEARQFLRWVESVSEAAEEEGYDLQIMYGLHGERDLTERELPHLEGYRGSRPVRTGNAAANQLQLDVYGELLGAAYELVRMGGTLSERLWGFLSAVTDEACRRWRERDFGIWEVRSEPQHFVFSKLMVWVALDRALRLVEQHGLPGPRAKWRRARQEVRRAILDHGFDPEVGSFVRAFGTKDLDASSLLLPVLDFLPVQDPRVQSTIDRIQERLVEDGMVRRYRAEDGLPGGEGAFVLCTFWLVDALTLSGRLSEAREVFDVLTSRSNHLGLYPEEIAPATGEFLGNFPQAFSHAGFINSALYLGRAEGRKTAGPAPLGSQEHRAEAGHEADAAV